MNLEDQTENINISPDQINDVIKTAMRELNISRKKATIEFMVFMCSHGDIDDFETIINYFIQNQKELMSKNDYN